jgi:hypothetical protein
MPKQPQFKLGKLQCKVAGATFVLRDPQKPFRVEKKKKLKPEKESENGKQ